MECPANVCDGGGEFFDEHMDEWVSCVYCKAAERKNDPWIICPTCRGDGVHVNPNIDAHGLTREDFDRDPDFAEMYWSGAFNQRCNVCRLEDHGKIRQSKLEELEKAANDRELASREDGQFEPGIRDYRYGI